MKKPLLIIALVYIAVVHWVQSGSFSLRAQGAMLLGVGQGAGTSTGTPTLFQSLSKNGISLSSGGSTTAAKGQIWNFDPAGPIAPTSGSLLIISGEWPNHPTTGGGYHAACTAPCSPAFVDTNSVALTKVFTEGSGTCYDGTYNHNIYYEPNIASTVTSVQDAFPALISNNVFNAALFYNVATSSPLDTESCLTGITPSNNTAPNISGTAMTLAAGGELVWIEIDDTSALQTGNAVSSITVPSNCYFTGGTRTPDTSTGVAHWSIYCIATSTSFTPAFTVAQTTHDTFSIAAAAFKSGSGGSAPSTGPGVLASMQTSINQTTSSWTFNVGCPANTTGLFVSDDSGIVSSITDSASNTYNGVSATGGGTDLGNGQAEIFSALGITATGMPNTFTITLHVSTGSNTSLDTIFCTQGISSLDALTAGSGSTQQDTHTVYNTSGTCTSDHCTNVPLVTPGNSSVLFFETCTVGVGPLLQQYNVTGNIADDVVPSASANIVDGDADSYSNGNMAGHYYAASTSQINFGWNSTATTAAPTCIVQAGH